MDDWFANPANPSPLMLSRNMVVGDLLRLRQVMVNFLSNGEL